MGGGGKEGDERERAITGKNPGIVRCLIQPGRWILADAAVVMRRRCNANSAVRPGEESKGRDQIGHEGRR